MSTERELTEKELILELIQDEELPIILKALNESGGNKKPSFQRMKVKQCLNAVKTKRNRLTPLEFLEEQLAYKKMKGLSIDKMIRAFRNPECEVPNIVQYFTIRHYHPGFFKEHYDVMIENVLNQRSFLSNIEIFQNEEDLKAYYLELLEAVGIPQNAHVQTLVNWYESQIGSLDNICERVKDWTLKDFDLNRAQGSDNIPTMLALLKMNRLDPEINDLFLNMCIHDCLVEQRLITEQKWQEQTEQLKREAEALDQTIKAQKKELKHQEQEIRHLLKRYEQSHSAEMKKKIDELDDLKKAYEKEKQQWEEELALKEPLTQKTKALEEELQWQKDLANTYQWSLKTQYKDLNIAVFHQSQFVYLPTLFPDIQFVKHLDDLVSKESVQTLFVQKYGMTHLQRRQLLSLSPNISVIELEGQEEREQLMELVHYLQTTN